MVKNYPIKVIHDNTEYTYDFKCILCNETETYEDLTGEYCISCASNAFPQLIDIQTMGFDIPF